MPWPPFLCCRWQVCGRDSWAWGCPADSREYSMSRLCWPVSLPWSPRIHRFWPPGLSWAAGIAPSWATGQCQRASARCGSTHCQRIRPRTHSPRCPQRLHTFPLLHCRSKALDLCKRVWWCSPRSVRGNLWQWPPAKFYHRSVSHFQSRMKSAQGLRQQAIRTSNV